MLFINSKIMVPFIIIMLISIVVLFKSPYNASNLDIVPDSVEYALGGNKIATEGSYTITVNGTKLPPRYPPWFPLLVIAPTYIIIGNEIGNAIFAITFFAILGIAITYLIGNHISGEFGGIFAALGLLSLPLYHDLARQIMTDVPCVSLILLLSFLYLQLRQSTLSNKLSLYTISGILIGLCSAFRPPCLSTILPFLIIALFSGKLRIFFARSLLLLTPVIIIIGANMMYNYYTFNSIFRNGYNFWCADRYDYLSLTFSTKYILSNLRQLFSRSVYIILIIINAIFLLKMLRILGPLSHNMKLRIKILLEFMMLGIGPLIIFYLLYFFPSDRFYLPFITLSVVIVGAMIGSSINHTAKTNHVFILLIILGLSVIFRVVISDEPPYKRIAVERILSNTPDNAIIISSIEPAYLEFFICRKSSRSVVPISRTTEYANKSISYHAIKHPNLPPKYWHDQHCAGLLNGGAIEAIPYTVLERPEIIVERIKEGIPIFIDTSLVSESDKKSVFTLLKWFEFTKEADNLFKLTIKVQ